MKIICTGECSFVSERGHCKNCGLLVDQLEAWDTMSEKEQKVIALHAKYRVSEGSENEPRKPYKEEK
jgi:predicted Fe-S protein YdhL (DUF1289 family)